MRAEGLEPSRSLEHGHLKPACLPVTSRPRAAIVPLPVWRICQCSAVGWRSREGGLVRSAQDYDAVMRLVGDGLNDRVVAEMTGVPRRTIWGWRHRSADFRPRNGDPCTHDFSFLPPEAYSYLLGLYLGDGCISRLPRVWRLRITLDVKYPAIIDRCRQAIDRVMPNQQASVYHRLDSRCAEVFLCSKHWPCLLPQHGPGRKHNRSIRLEKWQQALVDQATEEFVLGLFHSDGCRTVANDRGVRSIRYHFSNRSEDILGLFTAALDSLGITWTRSDKYTISIYRKAATARLDEFAGPKAVAVPWNDVHYDTA